MSEWRPCSFRSPPSIARSREAAAAAFVSCIVHPIRIRIRPKKGLGRGDDAVGYCVDWLIGRLVLFFCAPQPTPRSDPRGIERLDWINQAVKNVPHSVLFLGNSLTEGWGPASWATSLAPRGVLNAGISGDLTDHVIWRLDHGNLDGPPP